MVKKIIIHSVKASSDANSIMPFSGPEQNIPPKGNARSVPPLDSNIMPFRSTEQNMSPKENDRSIRPLDSKSATSVNVQNLPHERRTEDSSNQRSSSITSFPLTDVPPRKRYSRPEMTLKSNTQASEIQNGSTVQELKSKARNESGLNTDIQNKGLWVSNAEPPKKTKNSKHIGIGFEEIVYYPPLPNSHTYVYEYSATPSNDWTASPRPTMLSGFKRKSDFIDSAVSSSDINEKPHLADGEVSHRKPQSCRRRRRAANQSNDKM